MADTSELPKKSTLTDLLIQALKEMGGATGIYNPQTNLPNLPGPSLLNNAQTALQNRPQQINSAVNTAAQ